MDKKCSIIISSCDNFSDVWDPFFTLFFKYWSNCPFKIYLISENKTYPNKRVSMISLGEDKKWASNIKLALQKIDTPYFIYLQEDYLLKSPVDTKRINKLLDFAIKNDAGCLKLFPLPKPDKKLTDNPELGEITKGKLYSVSLQAAIWKKEVFESLLVDGETGWNMEFNGSRRSVNISEPFLSVYIKALNYPDRTAIKKGMWLYDAMKLCQKEGLKIDKTKRKVEKKSRYILRITGLLSMAEKLKRLFDRF
jgi:hypothetical protein